MMGEIMVATPSEASIWRSHADRLQELETRVPPGQTTLRRPELGILEPIGPDRRLLIADSSAPGKMKWDWLKVGADGYNRIEIHDHDTDGFIHFYAALASETFHGNLYQDVSGAGGARQARLNFWTSQLNGGTQPHLHLRSQSEDGTLPSDAHLQAGKIHLDADQAILGPTGHNPLSPDDLARKAYVDATAAAAAPQPANSIVTEFGSGQSATSGVSGAWSRGDHTHGTPFIPAAGNTIVNEFGFGQSSFSGNSGLFSRVDHTHGTPLNPVLTNHARHIAVDGINPNNTQVQIQVGQTIITTDANGNALINYGASFNNTTLNVQLTNGDANAGPNTILSSYGYIATQFGVHVHRADSNTPAPAGTLIRVHWIAVGY